jgi:hypothetical protein
MADAGESGWAPVGRYSRPCDRAYVVARVVRDTSLSSERCGGQELDMMLEATSSVRFELILERERIRSMIPTISSACRLHLCKRFIIPDEDLGVHGRKDQPKQRT